MQEEHVSKTKKLDGELQREQWVLLILAAVQAVTILDFMIVMPLGPQLMRSLNIGPAAFGVIVSSYTFAAGIAGLVASAVVDRFARRTTFMTLYAGFLIGTLLCGLAPNYLTLVLARTITGAFGGILGGLSMVVIGDVFPESRRGRATSSLMTGFAIASVAGVPLGLVLGTNFGWQMPFIALAIAGVPPLLLVPYALPKLAAPVGRVHVHPLRSLAGVFAHVNHLNAFALIFALTLSSFMVFPYLSAYLVGNVGMSEQQLPLIYIHGGLLTLVAAPIVGRMADRHGKLPVFRVIAPISAVLLVVITHLPPGSILLAIVVFGCLMVCNVGRMIPAMAMVTSSVEAHQRGAFLSVNSSIQHITGGLGAYWGGLIVAQGADGQILNFPIVGWLAAAAACSSLWLAGRLRVANAAPTFVELASAAATVESHLAENVVSLRLKSGESGKRALASTSQHVE
jgi:DHA1 family inner membrane transport protein